LNYWSFHDAIIKKFNYQPIFITNVVYYQHFLDKTFRFSNSKGDVFGEITFGADGKIHGYDNPNERTWTFENGCLHVWGGHKQFCYPYNEASFENGKLRLEIALGDTGMKHCLAEI